MRENRDQNNPDYRHFLGSDFLQSMLVLVSLPFKQRFLQNLLHKHSLWQFDGSPALQINGDNEHQ